MLSGGLGDAGKGASTTVFWEGCPRPAFDLDFGRDQSLSQKRKVICRADGFLWGSPDQGHFQPPFPPFQTHSGRSFFLGGRGNRTLWWGHPEGESHAQNFIFSCIGEQGYGKFSPNTEACCPLPKGQGPRMSQSWGQPRHNKVLAPRPTYVAV